MREPTPDRFAVRVFFNPIHMELFVVLTLILWLMVEQIIKNVAQTNLYNGRFAKIYELKKVLGKRPWWSFYKWLRWLRFFWKYNRGFALTQDQHLSQHDSNTHMVVVGTTGSGKTINPVLQTLLNLEGQSVFVTDISGELYKKASGYLAKNDYLVWKIDPTDPEHSDTLNPMDYARTLSEINNESEFLISSSLPPNGRHNIFWNKQGKVSIMAPWEGLSNQPNYEYRNLANLYRLMLEYDRDEGTRLDGFIADYAYESYQEYAAFTRQDPRLLSNSLSSAKAALSIWSDPDVAKITATTSIDLSLMRKRKVALFICVPQDKQEVYKDFISYMVRILKKELYKPVKKGDLDVMLLLEEFANSGACIPGFENIITTIRKYRVSIMMIVQDLKQMVNLVGEARTTSIIDGGTAHAFYLPLQSLQSARYISEILGKTDRTYTDPITGELRHTYREVMTVDEIMRLPLNTGVYHKKGLPPALIHMRPYFHSRRLRKRSRIQPVEIVNPNFHKPLKFYPLKPVES